MYGAVGLPHNDYGLPCSSPKTKDENLSGKCPNGRQKRVLVCFPSNGWKLTPTDKRQINTYGNLACLLGMAGSEHKKATSYSISGEQKQNHRMFMFHVEWLEAESQQATSDR